MRTSSKNKKKELTACATNDFIVPVNAAAIPKRPLFNICMATLKPSPTPAIKIMNK